MMILSALSSATAWASRTRLEKPKKAESSSATSLSAIHL